MGTYASGVRPARNTCGTSAVGGAPEAAAGETSGATPAAEGGTPIGTGVASGAAACVFLSAISAPIWAA